MLGLFTPRWGSALFSRHFGIGGEPNLSAMCLALLSPHRRKMDSKGGKSNRWDVCYRVRIVLSPNLTRQIYSPRIFNVDLPLARWISYFCFVLIAIFTTESFGCRNNGFLVYVVRQLVITQIGVLFNRLLPVITHITDFFSRSNCLLLNLSWIPRNLALSYGSDVANRPCAWWNKVYFFISRMLYCAIVRVAYSCQDVV